MHGSNKRRRLFLQLGSITLVAIEALQQHRWNMVAKHDLESSKMFCIFLFYVLDKGMRIWAGRVGHIPGSLIKMMNGRIVFVCF